MLNFVLCDDNANILSKLSKMLEAIFIEHNIEATIGFQSSNANDMLSYVKENKIDVLFLDINLKSEITGFDIADLARKKNKSLYLIFTTGHLEYALIAYKYKTFDYLPKPIVQERLEETIIRLIEDMSSLPSNFIKLNNKLIINECDINYIKKDGMKLVFYTNTRTYETYNSFNKIESSLPENFVRCHKSYIANINNISNIVSNNNTIIFTNNHSCSIGAKYKSNILNQLKALS